MFTLLEQLSQEIFTKLTVTTWPIWWARHRLIHEGIDQSPLSTYMFITHFIMELGEIHPSSGNWVCNTAVAAPRKISSSRTSAPTSRSSRHSITPAKTRWTPGWQPWARPRQTFKSASFRHWSSLFFFLLFFLFFFFVCLVFGFFCFCHTGPDGPGQS